MVVAIGRMRWGGEGVKNFGGSRQLKVEREEKKQSEDDVYVWASWGAAVLRPYMMYDENRLTACGSKNRRQDAGATS
jgi:hypothetical protein